VATDARPLKSELRLATNVSWGGQDFLIPENPPTAASVAALRPGERNISVRLMTSWHSGQRLAEFISGSGGGACCFTAADIEAGEAWWSSPATSGSGDDAVLIVPDGVARVAINVSGQSFTAAVHGNAAAFEFPTGLAGAYRMTWYGESGEGTRRFSPVHSRGFGP
jgi:hypothetical protein